jgi:hypothetical protein
MDGGAPAPLAAVEPSDLTEGRGGPGFASEPTARFLNALLAKVEALEAESRTLKAGLVPLIKSVAAAPREAPAEGVPGEPEPQQGDELVAFVPAAGLTPAEVAAARALFAQAVEALQV